MAALSPQYREPTHHEIAAYAHSIWEAEGRPVGRELCHWFQEQAHLIASRQVDAGMIKIRKPKTSSRKNPAGGFAQTGARRRDVSRSYRMSPEKRQEETLIQSAL